MTLFEVVAASVLLVMLLAAMSNVLTGLSRQAKQVEETVDTTWVRRLRHRLEWDLRNTRYVSVHPNQIVLEGFSGRDPASGHPLHSSARVIYQVVTPNNILLRHESATVEGVVGDARTELMAMGISELLAGRWDDRVADLRIPVPDQALLHPLPDGFRLILVHTDGTLTEQICWRGER
jgi:hypothetical protein